MLRGAAAILLALLLVPLVPPGAEGGSDAVFTAGAARADITPPVGTPMFAYTARHAVLATAAGGAAYPHFLDQRDGGVDTELHAKTFLRSEGVHTRLYASAIVLDDGERAVALVLADLGGIPGELHQGVADRLAAMGVPIPRENLLIGATHTHGGPGAIFQYAGYAALGGDIFDPRVFGLVADQTAKAVADAYARREPARLAIGAIEVPDASRNRAVAAHLTGHDHGAADDHIKTLARVIRVDALDGTPIGVVTNFAAHGTIVDWNDLLMTGDNQGVAARLLARRIGDAARMPERDVVVVYLNGAQGDVSPVGAGNGFFERVEDAGQRQAEPLYEGWRRLHSSGTTKVDLDARFKFICFCGQEVENGERISPIPILGQGEHQTTALGVPGHGGKVPLLTAPGGVPMVVRLQVLRINDYVMLGMPGEASVALGEEIEARARAIPGVRVADVVGLANDYVSYMSTVPEYDYQNYEGSFNLYGRMTGPLFRNELLAMADAMMAGEPVAPGHMGVLQHPDTSTPSVPTASPVPGRAPEALEQPATSVARGESATFAWAGGSPSVDHPVDVPMVEVVHAASGRVVADDLGFELRVRYEKVGADVHRWSAEWPVPEDAAGEYAFRVAGRALAVGGVEPYDFESSSFVVA